MQIAADPGTVPNHGRYARTFLSDLGRGFCWVYEDDTARPPNCPGRHTLCSGIALGEQDGTDGEGDSGIEHHHQQSDGGR